MYSINSIEDLYIICTRETRPTPASTRLSDPCPLVDSLGQELLIGSVFLPSQPGQMQMASSMLDKVNTIRFAFFFRSVELVVRDYGVGRLSM